MVAVGRFALVLISTALVLAQTERDLGAIHRADEVPIIDISPLRDADADPTALRAVVSQIGEACKTCGFFYVVGHGVKLSLQQQLQDGAEKYFALPRDAKRRIAMADCGRPGRGYFEVGEESTSGLVDEKEGLYFAQELPDEDPRPLHGANLFPSEEDAPGMRKVVLEWMDEMKDLGAVLMQAVSAAIGLDIEPPDERWGLNAMFDEPTMLFRIFHYPPHEGRWGDETFAVGEHSDSGFLGILKQDNSGGLQSKGLDGEWHNVPPVANSFVINLGDALEYATSGLLRATPHRVLQRRDARSGRFSFPFFFDPAFNAPMASYHDLLSDDLQIAADQRRARAPDRWDGGRVEQFEGSYGQYLLNKQANGAPKAMRDALLKAAADWDLSQVRPPRAHMPPSKDAGFHAR